MAKPWYVMIEIPYKNITDKSKHYNTIIVYFFIELFTFNSLPGLQYN
jgi:hypothetical protein